MFDKKKAFTVIEILIIVAIIGLLVSIILIGLSSTRNKAKNNSFKTTIKSIQTNLVSCCVSGDVALPNGDVSGVICSGGENYPGPERVGSIAGQPNCASGSFSKTITPGTKNSGGCSYAIITAENIDYFGC
jgi:type II secretory pathway pseudopilin PulG